MDAKKKSRKINLEELRGIFFRIGLIVTLFAVFVAFEWKSYYNYTYEHDNNGIELWGEDDAVITIREPEPPKQRPNSSFVIVEEHIEIKTDIYFDAGDDQNTASATFEPELDDEPDVVEYIPFIEVPEVFPSFPGGAAAMRKYITKNLVYPQMAKEIDMKGKVYVSFIVEADGSLSNIKVKRGIGDLCDDAAMGLVKKMPRWIPGQQGNLIVRVPLVLPIIFELR